MLNNVDNQISYYKASLIVLVRLKLTDEQSFTVKIIFVIKSDNVRNIIFKNFRRS